MVCLYNVTVDDISIILVCVIAHRCTSQLKKFYLQLGSIAIARGQSSKTKWFGIKSAKLFSVRMDVQFSSFFTNIRK